ncbi:hypothetical protein SmJEL517_g01905 [Synchytrium microbalum]|uniref:Uncharacterized protein n=1 Tax=Synchytrium microbalum TaxID=1806994 RepID=A0A507CCC5_9FUNG|nr:uncharacterized protein SmJEL517_g01905 [Synchytrium microbalum]TPX35676.1 hypothetical protein SmJEL517_g01905 [Synchytrium microbalum]
MPSTRKGKAAAVKEPSPSPSNGTKKSPKKTRESEDYKDTLTKVHSQINDLGADGVKKVVSRHVLGVSGGRITKRGKVNVRKNVVRELQALTPSDPSEAKSKAATAAARVSITAQIAKRGVHAELAKVAGGNQPISRIAHMDVRHGLPVNQASSSVQRAGLVPRKEVDDKLKKALVSELGRIAGDAPVPSVAAAKVGMSYAKTAVNAQLVKRAVVHEIEKRGAQ